jgi:hypothetical protein
MRPAHLAIVAVAGLGLAAGCLGTTDPTEEASDPTEEDLAPAEARLSPEAYNASEVTVETDPIDPEHVVAAANSEGPEGAGFGVYESTDGGATWNATFFAPEDVRQPPDGAPFEAISDPVLAFGPNGTLYLSGLAYLPSSAVFVAESPDGDAEFETTHVVHESDVAAGFNDKEWLGVNPDTGTLIVAWQKEPALDQLRTVEQEAGADADVGEIVFARSTDGGDSWSDPEVVSRGMQSNGTQVAFTSGGGVAHMLWVNYDTNTLDHVRSTDDGATWSDPQPVAPVDTVPPYPRYPRMHTLPALASDADGTELYAVWHDNATGDADVLAVASPDEGETWTEPVRVTDDEPGNGVIQMYPWADVGPNGTLHVAWYDARETPETPAFGFYHSSAPGPSLNFSADERVSNATFEPFADEPGGSAVTLGDYTGIAASEAGVVPAWADARHDRPTAHAALLPPAGGAP